MTTTVVAGNDLQDKVKSGHFSVTILVVCLLLPLVAAALAPKDGKIRAISGQVGSQGGLSHFEVAGDGVCGKLLINFGDGTPAVVVTNYYFATAPALTHTYTGWSGKKIVKVTGLEKCTGMAQMIFTVGAPFKLGYAQPRPSACDPVLNRPVLRANTKVHITTNPDPNVKINFGCLLNGCIYDANGMNGAATPGYPFPGLRPLSLVLRVGTQVVQGGTNVTFTTNQMGRLEVCANDDNMSDNSGAWGLTIDVDETAATGPPLL